MTYRFYYAGIRVRNLPRSLRFYTKALGMKPDNKGTMGHGGKYVQLVSPRTQMRLELNWYPPGSEYAARYTKGEELDHLAFVVDDVARAYADLLKKGAKPVVPPAKAKRDNVEVYVKDPDGIWIELLQG
jgi:catechol 2,3-dioxygenase-like lactoylglutathione lyase family enzyme